MTAPPAASPPSRLVFPAPVRAVRAAFTFLTRIPVGGFPYSPDDWAWTSAHFPLVGAILGALLGLLYRCLLPAGPLAAALLVIGIQLLLTGAFHEDGLADTADALGGAYERGRILEILKDSRIGTFGAAALIVSIGARAALLIQLGAGAAWALPLVGGAARTGPVWLMWQMPYVTQDEQARSRLVVRGRLPQALLASAWLAVLGALAVAAGGIPAARLGLLVALVTAVTVLSGWRYHRRLGGITGDFLGATEQLGEIVGLLALAWGM